MVGTLPLQLFRGFLGLFEIEGIDFFKDGGSFRRQSELCSAARGTCKGQEIQTCDVGAAKRRREKGDSHSKKFRTRSGFAPDEFKRFEESCKPTCFRSGVCVSSGSFHKVRHYGALLLSSAD
jgi:hypothetical protein